MAIDAADIVTAALTGAFVFLLVLFAWKGVSATRNDLHQDIAVLPWAFATAILWHPGLWQALSQRALFTPLPGDSFLALSTAGRIGLVLIALIACLALLAISVQKTRALRNRYLRRATLAPGSLDMAVTALFALIALTLAPQIFYLYYTQLSPDASAQWVIGDPLSGSRLRILARPLSNGSLGDHAAALALWTVIIACLFGWLLDVRRRRRALGSLPAAGTVAGLAMLWSLVTIPLA